MTKKEYAAVPPSMAGMEAYGFSWMDFVTAIPAPLFVVTTVKANGLPNACLQSWASFVGDGAGFYAILSNVNKAGHLYQTARETGVAALNFPSADVYPLCLQTIAHNGYDEDEIAAAGLTAEPAAVNAPLIKECFLNLEARLAWERDLSADGGHAVMCFEVTRVHMDASRLDEAARGRYGEGGYLYNVHYPVNPENFGGKARDYIAVLRKLRDMGEY